LAVAIGKSLGPVSIVVNNAGICPRHGLDSPELERLWDQAMDINLRGTLNVSLAFLDQLKATKGTIVN
ncbi:SDR family NAD(P)-dependent oxidoreductase, partial [Serratia marcescens]